MKNIFCNNRVLISFSLLLPPTQKKVVFVIFGADSLSIPRKGMIKTKLLEKMALKSFHVLKYLENIHKSKLSSPFFLIKTKFVNIFKNIIFF